jgi:hypothetical protein
MSEENKPFICYNCGSEYSEGMKFCPSCGTAVSEENTLPTTKDFFHEFINYDPAIWYTLKELILHPGVLTQKFISGDHNKVTSPAKLFILISAVTFFVGIVSVIGDSANEPAKEDLTVEITEERPGLELEIKTSTGLRINNIEYYKEDIDSLGAAGFLESRNTEFNPIMYWVVKRTVQKYQQNDYEEININHERNASILLYLLIPIFALYMKMFRRRKSFTEHITFTLYFFSSFYMIMLISKVVSIILNKGLSFSWLGLASLPFIWTTAYLIIAVKKNYEFNWIAASLIGLVGGILLLIFIILLLILSSLLILSL